LYERRGWNSRSPSNVLHKESMHDSTPAKSQDY
jgi:hypothetical protein